MKREAGRCPLILCLAAGPALLGLALPVPALQAQQPAESTETAGHPFSITQTWNVGGTGPWDYMTMDTRAERLYIAHGHSVQVVDVTTGALAGEISGLVEAHAIALDDTGEFGYISDGPGSKIFAFDRRTLDVVATIDNVPSPRALVFEPQTHLLFAVRTDIAPATPAAPKPPRSTTHITPRPAPPPPAPANPQARSSITVIDTQTQKVVGQILLAGTLGFAQADSRGNLYVNVTDRDQIIRIDAEAVAPLLPKKADADGGAAAQEPSRAANSSPASVTIDWTDPRRPLRSFLVHGGCTTPKSLAIDSAHSRLFAACGNMKLFVLNADDGSVVDTLPIGPGVDGIGYDANHGLIFSANGGADGSLTIIRQHVTDSYNVIQTLPTRQRARTVAVNPDTGQVYVVTDLLGVDLSQPANSGPVTTNPVNGTFQVLVIGN